MGAGVIKVKLFAPVAAGTGDHAPPDSHANEGEESPSELDSQIQDAGWQRQQSPSPRGVGSAGREEGAEEEEEEGERRLSVRDVDLVRGLLEVMVVVWEVLSDRLDGPRSKELRKKLLDRTEKNLPVLLQTFTVSTEEYIGSLSCCFFLPGWPPSVDPLPTCLSPPPLLGETHCSRVPADSDLGTPALVQDARPHLIAGGTVVVATDRSGGRAGQSVAVASAEWNRQCGRRWREEQGGQATSTRASETNKKESE